MSPGPVQQARRTSSGPEGSSDKVHPLCAAVNLGSSGRTTAKPNVPTHSPITAARSILAATMSYQALARKYRPQSFHDVVGQETVVRTLQNAIEQERIHHAYLFSGVRGVGKTTSARILAKALNCVKGPTLEPCNECTNCREITEGIDMDVREIDAATYTGVDNVRELRDVTQFQPARDRYRIFIIDEAHMLSTPAWNALLKILEEPPPHVVFMFATTEMQKIPATILSRVQKFALRKITLEELIERLQRICGSEGIEADRDALEIVARRGEGSVRDALSILDQVIAFSGRSIHSVDVAAVLGLSENTFFARIAELIAAGDHAGIVEALDEAVSRGRDLKMLYRDFLSFIRGLLLVAAGADEAMLSAAPEDLTAIRSSAKRFSYSELLRVANLLLRDDETVNRAEHQRLAVEIALLKAATFPRLRAVEDALAQSGGSVAANARPAAPARRPAPETSAAAPAVERPPVRAAAPPQPPAERAEKPAARRAAAKDSSNIEPQEFVDRVQAARPLLGSYLAGSKSIRRNGDRLLFIFDAAQSFFAESLRDQIKTLEEIAQDVYGTSIKLDVQVEGAETHAEKTEPKTASPLNDDPVLKAFQKHLGGEIVESRKR